MKESELMQLMIFKSNDIIYSPNYNGFPNCGYDIALMGISDENNVKL